MLLPVQDDKLTKGAALLCRVTCSPPRRLHIVARRGPQAAGELGHVIDDTLLHADLAAYPEYILCYDGKALQ